MLVLPPLRTCGIAVSGVRCVLMSCDVANGAIGGISGINLRLSMAAEQL